MLAPRPTGPRGGSRPALALAMALGLAGCGTQGDATEPRGAGTGSGEPEQPTHDDADAPSIPRDAHGLPESFAAFGAGPRLTWPVERVHVTSHFGWRLDPVSGLGVRLHQGIDLRGKPGDLVLSIADGTVSFVGVDPALGNLVIIDHGEGVQSLYGHLSDVLVHGGLPVPRGAAIGLVGNTGRSAAPHLHLTIKVDGQAIDPLLLLGAPLHDVPGMAGDPAEIPGRDPVDAATGTDDGPRE